MKVVRPFLLTIFLQPNFTIPCEGYDPFKHADRGGQGVWRAHPFL